MREKDPNIILGSALHTTIVDLRTEFIYKKKKKLVKLEIGRSQLGEGMN